MLKLERILVEKLRKSRLTTHISNYTINTHDYQKTNNPAHVLAEAPVDREPS